MAKKPSFLERVQPSRERTRLIDWPFETDEPVKVRMRVLGASELEAAHFEAMDHFKDDKRKVAPTDQAFLIREQIALVWRAFETEDGEKIALDTNELASQQWEILSALYSAWSRFQDEITVRPMTQEQLDTWIDGLKKNTLVDLLPGLPSSWLIKLISTLANQLAVSTTANERG